MHIAQCASQNHSDADSKKGLVDGGSEINIQDKTENKKGDYQEVMNLPLGNAKYPPLIVDEDELHKGSKNIFCLMQRKIGFNEILCPEIQGKYDKKDTKRE